MPRKITIILKEAFKHWTTHNASRLGAALSYYTVFSLAPLVILVIALVSLFVDRSIIESALLGQIGSLIGTQGREFLQSILVTASKPTSSIVAAVIGFITVLVGALGVLTELKDSMNDFWNLPQPIRTKKGIFSFVHGHLLPLSLIPVLVFLLLISLVFSSVLSNVARFIGDIANIQVLFTLFDLLFSLAIVTFLFAFIYRYLPRVKLPWRETLPGAATTSILFAVGKYLISIYLAKVAGVAAFGAASALVIIMVWTFYSIQIFFFGASITYVYSKHYGYLKEKNTKQL